MVVRQITRRGLLQLLPALPLLPNLDVRGNQQGVVAKVTPRYYMIFVDTEAFNLDTVLEMTIPVPDVEMEFFALRLKYGQTIDDAVKIYEASGLSE